ncbi:MAG: GTPase HflX, partial [Betaproteobacteria bacterium]|nr:GTPase HflX [Betaproteobacteria bacterium]
GKSTLFNAMVKARTYAADQLFATLDTTTRQLYLGDGQGRGHTVSLSDTVGFIRDLPHTLVDAFEATLQEAAQADLLLHVVDASHPDWTEQLAQVQSVLADIGAADIPQWLIFNKVDQLPLDRQPLQAEDVYDWDGRALPRVFLSAVTGQGMAVLRQRLAEFALSRHPQTNGTPDAEDMGSPHDSAG